MKNISFTSILLAGVVLAGNAFAEMEPSLFEEIDTDHNGAISMKEAKARSDLSKEFNMIDSNGDGSLSVDEYTAYENKDRMAPEEVEVPEPGAAPMPSH
jgi:Ca2+-binding EF-hand superfamily protein